MGKVTNETKTYPFAWGQQTVIMLYASVDEKVTNWSNAFSSTLILCWSWKKQWLSTWLNCSPTSIKFDNNVHFISQIWEYASPHQIRKLYCASSGRAVNLGDNTTKRLTQDWQIKATKTKFITMPISSLKRTRLSSWSSALHLSLYIKQSAKGGFDI